MSLPPELWDHSLDFLSDDPATLASCALVKRQWYNRAHKLLLSRVRICNHRAYAAFRAMARSSPQFKRELADTQALDIHDDPEHRYAHAVPMELYAALPSLTSFIFRHATWNKYPPHQPYRIFLSNGFSSVHTLQLYSCRFRYTSEFIRFVCGLRALRDLTLVGTDTGRSSPPYALDNVTRSTGLFLRLRRLHVEGMNEQEEDRQLSEILGWLACTPTGGTGEQSLRSLHVRPLVLTRLAGFHVAMANLLKLAGSLLQDLETPVVVVGPQPTPLFQSRLRLLVLRYTFREHWATAWVAIGWMLATMSSPHLRTLELMLTIIEDPGTHDLNHAYTQLNMDWSLINKVLASPSFDALQEAAVTLDWQISDVVPPAEIRRLRSTIEDSMKQLQWYERGILTISHREHYFATPVNTKEQKQKNVNTGGVEGNQVPMQT